MSWKLSPLRSGRTALPLLVEAARYGDSVAYDELISRCYPSVLRYCSSMGSPLEAPDLAQETFLRALKSKTSATEITNIEGFMIHIARCVCADYVSEIRKTRSLNSEVNRRFETTEHNNEVLSVEDQEILQTLNESLREPFVLTQLLGFSYEECSSIIGVPIGTIRSRVARARQSLKVSIANA